VNAKGKIRAQGGKLAAYLMQSEEGERAELIETRGLEAFGDNPVSAFDVMEQVAKAHTRSTKPFFHGHIRIAPNERLTDPQWMESVDRMEKRLGFTGQPRMVSFHTNTETGEKHVHVAWFRMDAETMQTRDPGMYKNHLKEMSRTLERKFALRELSNARKPEDRARAAGRNEVEQSRRLGTDSAVIRTAILDSYEQSDNGKAFKAALETRGMMLANGDRRDCFVVVDAAGGIHGLNKKLTGQTLAVTRDRLADLARAQLPSVAQAQARQAEISAARTPETARQKPEQGARVDSGPAAARGGYAPLNEPPRAKPFGATAGEIRLAWELTGSGRQFAERLEDKGLILVFVTAEEAKASRGDRQSRTMREGFAVVDQRGAVTRIDQRVTGDLWEEIEKKLGSVDHAQLVSVGQAREVMREAHRAAGQEKKTAEREQARRDVPISERAAEIRMAWNVSKDADPAKDAAQLHDALAVRGIRLAVVSAVEAEASREKAEHYRQQKRDQEQAKAATARGRFADLAPSVPEPARFASELSVAEIVAVDGFGNVHRLDERTTGSLRRDMESRLNGINRLDLLTVTDAQKAAREASKAAWLAERERSRPPNALEARIIECAEQARHFGAEIERDREGKRIFGADVLAARFENARIESDRLKSALRDPHQVIERVEPVSQSATVFGAEAVAARLEQAGIAVVRTTAADIAALDALRRDAELTGVAARVEGVTNADARHFAELKEGDLAAVTHGGSVHRINADKLAGVEIITADLPGVIDARKAFEVDHERTAKLWAERRGEVADAKTERESLADVRARARGVDIAVEGAVSTTVDAIEKGVRTTGRAARVAEKVFQTGFNLLFGWAMTGPKRTAQQVRDEARAEGNVETQHANTVAAVMQANEEAHAWQAHASKSGQQEKDLRLSQLRGTNPTAEANLGADPYDRQREQERERD
jgi:hypothetical protein